MQIFALSYEKNHAKQNFFVRVGDRTGKPMTRRTEPLDCVAFILIRSRSILAEKRKQTKAVAPGIVAIPGGHVDSGETIEAALHRELMEEIRVTTPALQYVCTLCHRAEEFRKIHYFAVTEWHGKIENHEAESLLWIAFDALDQLDLEMDQLAVREYLRVYVEDGA